MKKEKIELQIEKMSEGFSMYLWNKKSPIEIKINITEENFIELYKVFFRTLEKLNKR